MTVLKNIKEFGYIKRRPKAYTSDGMSVGGNKGFVLAAYPRDYPKTSQQQKVSSVAKECGIHGGISRGELRKKMIDCVGPKLRK